MTFEDTRDNKEPVIQTTTAKLNIETIVSLAWKNVSGSKGVYFLAALCLAVINLFVLGFNQIFLRPLLGQTVITLLIESVISAFVLAPLLAALTMMGVKRSQNIALEIRDIFKYFPIILPLGFLSILVGTSIYIGMMLLFLPGIYLMVTLSLAIPVMIDQQLNPLEAYKTSFLVVNRNFFSVLGIFLISFIAVVAGALLFLVGLVWAMPFSWNCLGNLYASLFKVKSI
jgi:hypothetical protein